MLVQMSPEYLKNPSILEEDRSKSALGDLPEHPTPKALLPQDHLYDRMCGEVQVYQKMKSSFSKAASFPLNMRPCSQHYS